MVAHHPARWGGWSSVVCCSHSLSTPNTGGEDEGDAFHSHLPPLPMLCLNIGTSPVRRQHFIYASEQVCIWWHRTSAYYTDKLTFSHGSLSKSGVCIIQICRLGFKTCLSKTETKTKTQQFQDQDQDQDQDFDVQDQNRDSRLSRPILVVHDCDGL